MKTICIDPGHGGDDNGAAWGDKYDYIQEDDLNLSISFMLDYELRLMGHNTVLTRERDINIPLESRVELANSVGADLFVSVHADAFHLETAKGFSAHVYPSQNVKKELAFNILSELSGFYPKHVNRGVRESTFYVIKKTKMTAVLVECEFISNPEMRRFLREPENQRNIARCIARGTDKFIKG